MGRILLAGLDPGLMQRAAQEFAQHEFFSAATGGDALHALATQGWQGAILGGGLPDMEAAEVVRRAAELLRLAAGTPVVALAGEGWEPLQEALADLSRATLAGQSPTPDAASAPDAAPAAGKRWGALKERFLRLTQERLADLAAAATALATGRLPPAQHEAALRAAHNIAGTAALFGYQSATGLARELEALLEGEPAPLRDRYAPLLSALQGELGLAGTISPPPVDPPVAAPDGAAPPAVPAAGSGPVLLLVDDDEILLSAVSLVAAEQGLRVLAARDLAAARASLAGCRPDVAIIDLAFPGDPEAGFQLLGELRALSPPIPVALLTGRAQFEQRLRASRAGAERFVQKPAAPLDVVEAAVQLLAAARPPTATVLAVDDDPLILEVLGTLLQERGVRLVPCADPTVFWRQLEAETPELVLLDVDMPGVDGIELCRVLRGDARYQALPVIFLTARFSIDVMRRSFAAGADDFIAKPIIEPELLTRVVARLDRARLQRREGDEDPLTRACTGRRFTDLFARYQHLARRQRTPLALAVLSIDELPPAGSDSLHQRLVAVLQRALRGEDCVGRLGGNQFAVAMFGASKAGAAHRLSQLVAAFQADPAVQPTRPSYSGGVAEYPVDGDDLPALLQAAEAALTQARAAGGGRVLAAGAGLASTQRVDVVLVDDDEVIGNLVLGSLKSGGLTAQWLRDGLAAKAALTGPTPSLQARLILMDVSMPGMNGLTLLRLLKAGGLLHGTRVIMLTARASEVEMLEGLRAGAFDYIPKPFSPALLLQRVQRTLGR